MLTRQPPARRSSTFTPTRMSLAACSAPIWGWWHPRSMCWRGWPAATRPRGLIGRHGPNPARADYLDWITPRETPGDVKLEQVLSRLSDLLPDDAIVTNGAGNFAAFLHRYFRARAFPGNLAPTSGSMGYGFPASIAAKLEHPDRAVVCVAGDGDFQMTLNELSTARQYGANVVVIVCNNGQYGTIRMHQEKTYPGRVSGTQLF